MCILSSTSVCVSPVTQATVAAIRNSYSTCPRRHRFFKFLSVVIHISTQSCSKCTLATLQSAEFLSLSSWKFLLAEEEEKKILCFPHRPCLHDVHARRAVWCHNVQVRCIRASHQARIVSKYQLVTMMTDRNKQIAAPFRGKRPVCWE